MTTPNNMQGRDVWLKTTDKKGKTWTSHHRCWDLGLFLNRRQEEAVKEGGSVEQVLQPPMRNA
jgi:hypothetical protein